MKLSKIKLINWHAFTNSTIRISGNFAVTGENASGKSTLIDAIYYVLSGGDSHNFNHAANDDAERTLETYVLYKTGADKNTFLRTRPAICHIALEFQDKSVSRILGVVITISDTNKTDEYFYTADNVRIEDKYFIRADNTPATFDDLKKLMGANRIKDNNTLWKRRELISGTFFNLEGKDRYNCLLKQALAFKPLDQVSSFVNDFLLNEEPIDVTTLQGELRSYQEIYHQVERTETKIKFLQEFIDQAKQFETAKINEKYFGPLVLEAQIQNLESDIRHATIEKEKNESRADEIKQKIDDSEKKRIRIQNEIHDLEKDDVVRAFNDKKKALSEAQKQKALIEEQIRTNNDTIRKAQSLAKLLELKFDLVNDIRIENFGLFIKHRKEYEDEIQKAKRDLSVQKLEYEIQIADNEKDQRACTEEIEDLKSHRSHYPKNVQALIDLLKNHFRSEYGEDSVEIRPLCEMLEFTKEGLDWSDAIEGYLDEERFSVFVSPKYYAEALKVYQENKDIRQISGVSILKAKKEFLQHTKIADHSLYRLLSIDNKHVDALCCQLFGDVICVDDPHDLFEHSKAITKDGQINRDNHYYKADPSIGEYPFIGEESFNRRLNSANNRLQALGESHKSLIEDYNTVKARLEHLQDDHIEKLKQINNDWERLKNTVKDIEELSTSIKEYEKDTGLFSTLNMLERLRGDYDTETESEKQYQSMRDEALKQSTVYETRINDALNQKEKSRGDLQSALLTIGIRSRYDDFRKTYISDGNLEVDRIYTDKNNNQSRINGSSESLKTRIRQYASEYNRNISTNLEDIHDVIAEYEKLTGADIVRFKVKAENAREKCESQFKCDFIAKLQSSIKNAHATLRRINSVLQKHPFGVEKEIYRFTQSASKDDEMSDYYRIIMSDKVMEATTLFDEELSGKDKDTINRLFDRITQAADSAEGEKNLKRYLDYRNYMTYDITITKEGDSDNFTSFSKTRREKSGGETQTPFYVIIAACFDELMNKKGGQTSTCPVIFDEAFNNMDETRIHALMDYYRELGIQIAVVVPTNRVPSIVPYMDTVVGLTKNGNTIDLLYVDKTGEVITND